MMQIQDSESFDSTQIEKLKQLPDFVRSLQYAIDN